MNKQITLTVKDILTIIGTALALIALFVFLPPVIGIIFLILLCLFMGWILLSFRFEDVMPNWVEHILTGVGCVIMLIYVFFTFTAINSSTLSTIVLIVSAVIAVSIIMRIDEHKKQRQEQKQTSKQQDYR